jgi:hypothetical protein
MTDKQIQEGCQPKMLREEDLVNFYGTEIWYRHPVFRTYLYTEGVQYVAEYGAAYWLLDNIFSCHASIPRLSSEEFCCWELKKNAQGQGAKLICTDGNDNVLYIENILFTDFPLSKIRFYCVNNILLLPTEY